MRLIAMRYLRVNPNGSLEQYDGGRPFRAIVVVEDTVQPEWQSVASKWFVDSGCLYMLAWGQDCSSWDTSVDLANLQAFDYGQIPGDRFVMTTWHEHEPLSEMFWFAKNCAVAATVEIVDTLVFHVSRTGRKKEYAHLYTVAWQAVAAGRNTSMRARRAAAEMRR
jgi:hypothetical protein